MPVTLGEAEAYRKAGVDRWFSEGGDPFEPVPEHASLLKIRQRADGACGFLSPAGLCRIHEELSAVIRRTAPAAVAIETPFAGNNVKSLIQLAHARGVILFAARAAGLKVFEYAPRSVKNAVVGYGAAEKEQVAKMVRLLVKGCGDAMMSMDASDALAVAICHAHHAETQKRWQGAEAGA